ncbi:hypothetical protein Tco_0756507 [Tanacetum coccineum]
MPSLLRTSVSGRESFTGLGFHAVWHSALTPSNGITRDLKLISVNSPSLKRYRSPESEAFLQALLTLQLVSDNSVSHRGNDFRDSLVSQELAGASGTMHQSISTISKHLHVRETASDIEDPYRG